MNLRDQALQQERHLASALLERLMAERLGVAVIGDDITHDEQGRPRIVHDGIEFTALRFHPEDFGADEICEVFEVLAPVPRCARCRREWPYYQDVEDASSLAAFLATTYLCSDCAREPRWHALAAALAVVVAAIFGIRRFRHVRT